MVVVDLFSGAGGLTEGFFTENYQVVAHVERQKWSCETLKTRICYHELKKINDLALYNEYLKDSNKYQTLDKDRQIIFDKYPSLKEKVNIEVINKSFGDPTIDSSATDIKQIINDIQKALDFNGKTKVNVIIGGPPCQAYSIIGRSRMGDSVIQDARNYLFYYYKDIVQHFQPDFFIFENVPGILNAQNGKIFESIKEEFSKINYDLFSGENELNPKMNILDASDFGVPQTRKRVILFGTRVGAKYPNFLSYSKKFGNLTTSEAIGDLPALRPGEGNDFFFKEYESNANLNEFQSLMRMDSIGILNHKARPHLDRDRRNYSLAIKLANEGLQLRYCDIPILDSTHKNKKDFEDRYKVHRWDKIPHTIVAHISKDGHYNIHPSEIHCRSITVREAARIQSFPDNYKFEGPRTWQYVQVGNAVPPLMSKAIAAALKNDYFKDEPSG